MDVARQIETLEYLASRRRSCRAFKPTPVARQTILRILGVAQKGRILVQQPTLADDHNKR
jgi:hypothetical protein